jgi:predicted RNA binding protein with dsRBD fold (UPF0201 family)
MMEKQIAYVTNVSSISSTALVTIHVSIDATENEMVPAS